MRALLAITARELRERWTLVLATFGCGFVLLVPALREGVPSPPAAVLMVPATWVLAALMGGSVIARDLGEGRLGFFFARPVAWWAIAGGKLLAALLLTLAAALAGVLPALLVERNLSGFAGGLRAGLASGALAFLLVALIALVGFGHAASVVYRARSPWAALDFLLIAGTAAGGVMLFRSFVRLGIVLSDGPTGGWGLALKLLLVALVPLTAAAVQVAHGRSDLRRGHVALSVTFWSGVLVWLAVLCGLLVRELAVTPATLATRIVTGAGSDGRFVTLLAFDRALGHEADFLYDTASGRSLRRGEASRPAFSADGRYVAWVEAIPYWRRSQVTEVQLVRLDGPGLAIETVELAGWLPREGIVGLALSPQADRLAIVQNTTLSVHEIPSGRTLSRNAASDGDWMDAAFPRDGELRAFRRVRPAVGAPGTGIVPGRIEVVSMSGGVPTSAIRLEAVGHAILISPPDRDRVLLREEWSPNLVSLHDAHSGRRLRTFSGEDDYQVRDAFLLEDGRIAVVEANASSARLRLALEGQPDRLLALPGGHALVGGELPGGWLAVGHSVPGSGGLRGETLFLSPDTGEARGPDAGLLPALRRPGKAPAFASGRAAHLFVSDAGELLRFDPTSGERQVLLPAAPMPR